MNRPPGRFRPFLCELLVIWWRPTGAGWDSQTRNGANMRARSYDFQLSLLGGLAFGLLALATPVAAAVATGPALSATSLGDAWRACNSAQLHPADRIANCTIIIDSREAKRAIRARALVGRGFGQVLLKNLDSALAD